MKSTRRFVFSLQRTLVMKLAILSVPVSKDNSSGNFCSG